MLKKGDKGNTSFHSNSVLLFFYSLLSFPSFVIPIRSEGSLRQQAI